MKITLGARTLVRAAALALLAVASEASASFTHQIPIKLPKGANGMQPDLGLAYSPGAGNGPLGMGWRLTGLAQIERVSVGEGVAYRATDGFAHSELGVLETQGGWYRTNKESFTRFEPIGACGSGPCSWKVTDRSGLVHWYGATADSRLHRSGAPDVRVWALSSVVDLFGNSWEATYYGGPSASAIYPKTITYTKGPGLSTYRTVEFSWDTRNDHEEGYAQGTYEWKNGPLLHLITVYSSGTFLRSYELLYQQSPSTSRSELVSVEEVGADWRGFPAQRFTWQDGGTGFAPERWATGQGGWVGGLEWQKHAQFLTGDFDGDGKADAAYAFNDYGYTSIDVHASTGGAFTNARWVTQQGAWVGAGGTVQGTYVTGDFNADGKADIARVHNDRGYVAIDVYVSTGSGFTRALWMPGGGIALFPQGGAAWQQNGTFVVGDYNADGKSDILLVWNDAGSQSYNAWISSTASSGFTMWTFATRQGGWIGGADWQQHAAFLPGDVNGDGRTDIIYVFNDGGLRSLDVHLSTGSVFSLQRWCTRLGPWHGPSWQTFLPGDQNGDGLTDVTVAYRGFDGAVAKVVFDRYTATTTSFAHRWSGYLGNWVGDVDWQKHAQFLPGDFNGDGRSDIAYVFNDASWMSIDAYISGGWPQRWETRRVAWRGGLDWAKYATFQTGDFDGNGKTDVAHFFQDAGLITMDVHRAPAPPPDLLTSVDNGLGGTVTVSYAPAPQLAGVVVPTSTAPGIPNTAAQPLVTRVTTHDGRGKSVSTRHEHADLRWKPGKPKKSRNLGFGSTTTIDEQTGAYTRTTFNQVPGYEGTPARIDAFTAAGQLVSSSAITYELLYPGTGTELVREKKRTASSYEGGQLQLSQETETFYDAYSNPTEKVQSATGLPPVTISTTYANDTARWILGRILTMRTTSGATVLGEARNTWTGDCLTEKADWLDTTNTWLSTTLTCDANGNVEYVTEPPTGDGLVRTTRTEYDPTFRTYPVAVTNALGHATRRTYNADGLVTSFTDVNNNVTAMTYDSFGRKLKETRPDGGTTEYVYGAYGNASAQYNATITKVDARSIRRTEYFDGSGFVYRTETTGVPGPVVGGAITFVGSGALAAGANVSPPLPAGLQPNDVLVMVVSSLNAPTAPSGWTKKVSASGLAVYWRRAQAGEAAPTLPAGNPWDSPYRAVRIAAYRGVVATGDPFEAASISTAPSIATVTENALVLLAASAFAQSIDGEYDGVYYPRGTANTSMSNATSGPATTSVFLHSDVVDLPDVSASVGLWSGTRSAVGPTGTVTQPPMTATAANGYVDYKSTTRALLALKPVPLPAPLPMPAPVCEWREKDAAGRPNIVENARWCDSAPYTPAVFTQTRYDDAGRVAEVKTPDGKTLSYTYGINSVTARDAGGSETKHFDARKRVSRIVDAAGQETLFGYDALGRTVYTRLPNGAETTIAYDSLGRKTRVTDPQLGTTTYAYDAVGNIIRLESAGKSVTFTYDALNRPVGRQATGEPAMTQGYDSTFVTNGIGRLTSTDDAGGTATFAYTSTGVLAATKKTIGGRSYTQSLEYDVGGRITRVTYPDGSIVRYAYDGASQLFSATLNGAMVATWSDYGPDGKPRKVAYGNGVSTSYAYDVVGHVATLQTTKGTTELQNLAYQWYATPTSTGENLDAVQDLRASKIVNGVNTDETQSYTYDALDRLRQATGVWGTKTYDYDAIGNPRVFGGLVDRTLVFNGQQVTSGTGLSDVAYDAAGNMVRKTLDGVTWEYQWTAENRLANARRNGVLTTAMTYDAAGQRVTKVYTPATGPTVTTTYVGNLYEVRTYGDGSPERHTLHVLGNGHHVLSVTKAGPVTTALNDGNLWRAEAAAASMYDPRTAGGAAMKSFHLARAALAYPHVTRWAGLGLLAAFAAWVIASLAASLLAGRPRSRRDRARPRGFAPGLRLASASVAIAMVATGCGPGGGLGSARSPLLTGDTTNGPAVGTHYYHRNHINSSSVVTDAAGNEATRIVYLPFGEISQANSVGVDGVTAKFTGQEYDAETGLYYYNARYYDPAIGRFASADSVVPDPVSAQAYNRYSYVGNNPIVYVDPTGHLFDWVGDFFDAIGDAAKAVAGAVARAAEWVANAAVEAAKFVARASSFAWEMIKQTVRNPIAIATFVVSVVLSVATLNPGPMILWIQATAASIAAQSMAMAAGVTNPTVLGIIGAVAGAAAGGAGLGELLKKGATMGVSHGLAKLQGDKLARWLGPLNALAASMLVNYVGDALGNALADGKVQDPGAPATARGGGSVEAGQSSLQLSEGAEVRTQATFTLRLTATATRSTKWEAMTSWEKTKFTVFSALRFSGGAGMIVAGITGKGIVGAGIAALGLGPIGAGLLAAGAISFGVVALGITLADVLDTTLNRVPTTTSRRLRTRRRRAVAAKGGWLPCPA